MGIALGSVWIFGGIMYVTNFRGISCDAHSRMRERWVSLDDGLIRRSVRIYFLPGAVPCWAFRAFCFVFGICGGIATLIYALR
jgi:hypothetical protein